MKSSHMYMEGIGTTTQFGLCLVTVIELRILPSSFRWLGSGVFDNSSVDTKHFFFLMLN